MRIGVCQFEPIFNEKKLNLKKIEKRLTDISADLIVLPELATTGYNFKERSQLLPQAEEFNGETYQLFCSLSKKNRCSYVVGFAEKKGDFLFNSAMAVNPDGSCKVYRKTHLFGNEKNLFDTGKEPFFTFKIKGGIKIGMMICFDWIFPEAARSLALLGADIIAHPANLVLPWCQAAMITRAIENRVFCITANRTGLEGKFKFTGASQIVSPNGKILLKLKNEEKGIKIIEIDPKSEKMLNSGNNLLAERKVKNYIFAK